MIIIFYGSTKTYHSRQFMVNMLQGQMGNHLNQSRHVYMYMVIIFSGSTKIIIIKQHIVMINEKTPQSDKKCIHLYGNHIIGINQNHHYHTTYSI